MIRSHKLLLLLLVTACVVTSSASGSNEPYQEVKVLLPSENSIQDLLRQNSNLEVMTLGDGDIHVLSRPSITEDLIEQGWSIVVVHEDLESHYASRLAGQRDYGVWHTFAEMVTELQTRHLQYPHITTAPFSIGQSHEGREIWAIKVSDNPDVDEDEPEVLIDGVHHAREIIALELPLFLLGYLCENYGTDPLATFLVDNREIWFVPMVNPDGFVYNEQTNPNGGGMWRKNRRDNAGSCEGVDPNRNYPYEWGHDNGSSGDTCSEVYRGPSAGSEPEIQAMINFINSRNFIIHDTVHSVVGCILIPWGYTQTPCPDADVYNAICAERTSENGYPYGTCYDMIHYLVSGGMNDWMYGEKGIWTMCTEVGGSDFWPQEWERDGLLAENLHSFLYLMTIAGPAMNVQDLAVSGGNGNGAIEPGETVDLLATIKNDGLFGPLEDVSIQLRCDDPYIVLMDVSNSTGLVNPGETYVNMLDPFEVQAEAVCPQGRMVTFTVVGDAAGGIHVEIPFVLEIGELPSIVANDFEDPGEEWIQDETHTASTGAFERIDPVATLFQPGDDTTPDPGIYAWITAQNPGGSEGTNDVDEGISATRSPDFDLSLYTSVRMSMNYFHGQRDAGDDSNDFFKIDVSSNGGGSWTNLVEIGDVGSSPIWRDLTINLEEYIDLTDQVRVRMQAADGAGGTGMGDIVEAGVDDFYLYDGGVSNEPPSAPSLVAPPDGAPDVPAYATLIVANATDADGDDLTYGFRIYSDAELTDLVASVDDVAEGVGQTSWTVESALPLGTYYWRAFAADPVERGLCMAAASFTVLTTEDVDDFAFGAKSALSAAPNPVREGTRIRYLVPSTLTSSLAIYDTQGREIRKLDTIPSATGWQEIVWDGRDDAGHKVPSGSYWVKLWMPGEVRNVRVVRID